LNYTATEVHDQRQLLSNKMQLLFLFVLFLLRLTSSNATVDRRTVKYKSPPITASGKVIGVLEIYTDEEPIDAIFDFCATHNLGDHVKQGILEHACGSTTCTRKKAVLFTYAIYDSNNKVAGTLTISEGDSPAAAINALAHQHNLPYVSSRQLLDMACDSPRIKQTSPCDATIEQLVVYRMDIPVDGVSQGILIILEGQEPADIIYQFCKARDLPLHIQKSIVQDACGNEHIPCTRDYAVMFDSGPIVVDGRNVGSIVLTASTGEPADTIYEFCLEQNLNKHVFNQLITKACNVQTSPMIVCTRTVPAIYRNAVQVDGVDLGEFVVLEGEEPVDAVFNFYKLKHRLGPSVRTGLLNDICSKKEIQCTRNQAKLFDSGNINLDGNLLKPFIVYENQEPADVAYEYSRHITPTLPRHVEDQLITKACMTIDINCTRTRALLVKKSVRVPGNCSVEEDSAEEENGNTTQPREEVVWTEPCQPCVSPHNVNFLVLDGEEPVDQVNRFCVLHNLTEPVESPTYNQHIWRNAILREVCNNHGIPPDSVFKMVCTRDRPMMYETSVQHGQSALPLIILEGDSPSQILYSFASKHGLPVNTIDTLMKQICSPPLGQGPLKTCGNATSRYKNIVFSQPIQIDNRTLAPLVLRDDTREPADVVDEYCLRHSIKAGMRNNIIQKVCASGQVVCSRLQPVIYRWPFINFTTGDVYGEVEILQGQVVVDVVHLYLLKLDHPMINRTKMEKYVVDSACASIESRYGEKCTRKVALYYENSGTTTTAIMICCCC
jgi:hypothetical protein